MQQGGEALQQLFVVTQEKQKRYSYFFDMKAGKNQNNKRNNINK